MTFSAQSDGKVDNLDEKHDGKSEPQTQRAADVGQHDRQCHSWFVCDDHWIVALQQYVQMQEVFADHRRQRFVLQC